MRKWREVVFAVWFLILFTIAFIFAFPYIGF